GWAVDSGWSIIADAHDMNGRKAAAGQACELLKLPFDVVVDTMDDTVAQRWSAWPERLFVVDAEGRVAYVGEQGPWGFWPRKSSSPYGLGEAHGYDHGEPLDVFLEGFLP
ncbi:MAG: deiodinase-like protein, partial [Longimicrobiales bacterium]